MRVGVAQQRASQIGRGRQKEIRRVSRGVSRKLNTKLVRLDSDGATPLGVWCGSLVWLAGHGQEFSDRPTSSGIRCRTAAVQWRGTYLGT